MNIHDLRTVGETIDVPTKIVYKTYNTKKARNEKKDEKRHVQAL